VKLFTIEERQNELRKEFERITDIIINKYQPQKIILFGSFADAKIHEWSDIDLLIIKETPERPVDRCIELFRLTQPKVGVDYFIYTPEEVASLLKERYSFLLDIFERGKVIYEKGN
jgi:predicted nucleotidyltransferase